MKINTIPKTFHLLHKATIKGRTFAVLGINENQQWPFTLEEIREMFYGDASLDGLIQGDGFFLRLPQVGDLLMISEYGVPSGWVNVVYWSATPSGGGHAGVHLSTGHVFDYVDVNNRYVAFEVIQ